MIAKKQINIFIVEDDKVFMSVLKADIEISFEKMPIKVYTFETGELCMEQIKKLKPHVVILDYHLNGYTAHAADGILVLDWIKKESPETNVIMLTINDNIEIASKSFKHGASDYVVKTETQFRKINYALFNLFKLMVAQSAARRYKHWLKVFFLCLGLLVAAVIAVRIINPSLIA